MLLPLGIEKGKKFDSDSATRMLLNGAASEAQTWLLDGIARSFLLGGQVDIGSGRQRQSV